ncbi:hypothetical protein Tco_0975766 [Tanacetum coccineum]|uniref:Uncharacterized protein n=1 Tax=Tanacetum coccineum TaxID=301880 RepID=A0ABQ5EFB2_9ASTR
MVGAYRLEVCEDGKCVRVNMLEELEKVGDHIETKVDDWEFKGVRGNVRSKKAIRGEATIRSEKTIRCEKTLESEKNRSEVKRPFKVRRRLREVRTKMCGDLGKERMSAMLSSDATFSMEMFPFGHCPEGNGDVSSVCSVRENNNNTNNNNKTNEDRDDDLDNVKTDDG